MYCNTLLHYCTSSYLIYQSSFMWYEFMGLRASVWDQFLSSPKSERGRGVCSGHSILSVICNQDGKTHWKSNSAHCSFLRTVKLFSVFCLMLSIKLKLIQVCFAEAQFPEARAGQALTKLERLHGLHRVCDLSRAMRIF